MSFCIQTDGNLSKCWQSVILHCLEISSHYDPPTLFNILKHLILVRCKTFFQAEGEILNKQQRSIREVRDKNKQTGVTEIKYRRF